ncbi:MAG TPA: hypothetical protein VJG32_22285 [Anaerolineae bacterium]|nr:hypothetical protein [Anaerolineae bacterium]
MDLLMIVLRLIHIFGGFLWFGIGFFYVRFLEPTVQATGPEGQRFIQKMGQVTPINNAIGIAAILTTLSGLLMYWRISGFQGSWITSSYGIGLTIGGLAGLAEFILGATVSGPTAARIAALGKELEAKGGPPSPEQLAHMQALQEKLHTNGVRGVLLLTIALIGMSIAQYL